MSPLALVLAACACALAASSVAPRQRHVSLRLRGGEGGDRAQLTRDQAIAQDLRQYRRIAVTFEVHCEVAAQGDDGHKPLIIGANDELGVWDPQAGVQLETSAQAWPWWRASVQMPAGQIVEYKYAVFNANATAQRLLAKANSTNTSRLNSSAPTVAKLEDWQFLRGGDVVYDWEDGGNHILKVGRRTHTVTDEFKTSNAFNPDHRPPSFVSGGGKGSGCFLDAEYYYATD